MYKLVLKEKVVEWVLNEMGINLENVMVFGDDFNDLGLFYLFGFFVVMGNVIIELKKCVVYIIDLNDYDGVVNVIGKFVI